MNVSSMKINIDFIDMVIVYQTSVQVEEVVQQVLAPILASTLI